MRKSALYGAVVLCALLTVGFCGIASHPKQRSPQSLLSTEQQEELFRFPKPISEATAADLLLVEGIGEAKAVAILRYVESHELASMKDLLAVEGVGEGLLERLEEYFTIS